MAVLYPSFLSFTVTHTNATREPSGEICVSPAETKLNKSFSVMFRFWAKAGTASRAMEIKINKRRDRIEFPFRIRVSNAAAFYRERIKPGIAERGSSPTVREGVRVPIELGGPDQTRRYRFHQLNGPTILPQTFIPLGM